MENRIKEHNERIASLEGKIRDIRHSIGLALREGDELRYGEIMAFVKANYLKKIWIRSYDGFDRVYGGEEFDFSGLCLDVKAQGTRDGQYIRKRLQEVATVVQKDQLHRCDDGNIVIAITVFELI